MRTFFDCSSEKVLITTQSITIELHSKVETGALKLTDDLSGRKCPNCGNELVPIVYGMVDPSARNDPKTIIGGCEIDGNEPWLGCTWCDFRGYPGGRTYKTFHTKPGYKPGTENSNNPEIIQREFDLLSARDEELWGWSDGLFEARLELLHRGVSEQEILNAYFENEHWQFMPFKPYEMALVYYSRPRKMVLGIGLFYAHERFQAAHHLTPEDTSWVALSPQIFIKRLVAHKSEGLETWELNLENLDTSDAYWEGESDFGSEFVAACLAKNWSVDPADFGGALGQWERPILWPYWLEYGSVGQI